MRWSWSLVLFVAGASLASAAEPAPLSRIAFGSCAHQDRPQPIWDAVVAAKPELFLFLGDTIYADTEDMAVMKAKYDKFAAVPGWKKLRATCPVLGVWDDHDYGLNDAGIEYSKKRESQQLFLDFFGEPAESPRRQQEGVYSAKVFGPPGRRVQVIMLDCRYHRSPLRKGPFVPNFGPYLPDDDPKATFLGETQWKWLGEQLRQPAELRLLASGIQVLAEDHGFEKWMNFPRERERLFALLKETKAQGVVVLSGDRHLAELSAADVGLGYPLYDLTSSGLNQANKKWRAAEANRHRIGTMPFGDHFGLITVDWSAEPRLTLQIRDVEGDPIIQQKLPLSNLRAKDAAVVSGPLPTDRPLTAAEAMTAVEKKVTVEFRVNSTGKTRTGGMVFLNSESDFRDDKNFTVVLVMKVLEAALKKEKIDDPAEHFRDKVVRVSGTVTLYRERPQLLVEDLSQIRLAK